VRAAGAWTNDAQITRPPSDAHIEKRPDAEAEDEREDRGERGWDHGRS
jgi:hypothetical protein